MAYSLSLSALPDLASKIGRPDYDRADLSPGFVHVGVGNFHRAHQALYMDDLFNAGTDLNWAIIGAGVRPADRIMRDRLKQQDWLTTIVELQPGANHARVTGSMIDFVPVAEDNAPLIARLRHPDIRIVSLTVTEGGYYIDPASGQFDAAHPDMVADAAAPEKPASIFGALIAALKLRRDDGTPPFTIMSCDNLPENGHVAQQTVLGLANLMECSVGDWIAGNVAFPNSMVDRITPATSDRERKLVEEFFGIKDEWPVLCEPFRQWVLEDSFPTGRPALENVGVTLTSNVAAYELMKIRILNGGHAAIAYPAALMGIHFVHDAMANPLIRGFLEKLERSEIIPIVPPVPDTDLNEYFAQIVNRFSNPDVGDTIPRLCQDGSNRQPKFILPTVRDRLRKAYPIKGLALVSALWCRYCAGETDAGETIVIDDINAPRLKEHAMAARHDPAKFLEMREVFGEVADAQPFREAFTGHVMDLWNRGTRDVLKDYLAAN